MKYGIALSCLLISLFCKPLFLLILFILFQALPRSYNIHSIADAGHRPALFPRADDPAAALEVRSQLHGEGGRRVHALGHTELLPQL